MSDSIVRLDGASALTMRADNGSETTIRLDRVRGAVVHAASMHDTLVLTTVSGDAYELSASGESHDAPTDTVAHVLAALFAMPEVMRGLRGFGSARAMPGSDHDRFFAPLVDALRAVRAAHDRALAAGAHGKPWRAAESLDATRIATSVRSTLANLAAERVPDAAPDRRALEAELLDETDELFTALDTLVIASQRLHSAPDDERVTAWRAWCAALGASFDAADRSWLSVVAPLTDARARGKR